MQIMVRREGHRCECGVETDAYVLRNMPSYGFVASVSVCAWGFITARTMAHAMADGLRTVEIIEAKEVI